MLNRTYDEQICAWLAAHRQQIVEDLLALVRIPSMQGEAAPDAPYGEDCRQMLLTCDALFARFGLATRTELRHGYTLGSWGEGNRTIGLFAHADVVAPGDGWLCAEPFKPVIRDGFIIGRGCADDKAAILASLCAVAMIRDLGLPMRSRLLTYAGVNEENGMHDVQAFLANETAPDLCLVPDGYFPCSLGEKSKLAVWAEYDTPLVAIRDFHGGVNTSAVLGEVDVTIAPDPQLEEELRQRIKDDPTYALRTEDDGTIRLHVTGVSTHAAWPEKSVNAAGLAGTLLADCAALPPSDRCAMAALRDYFSDSAGRGLGIAFVDPQFGPLTSSNSLAETKDGKLRVNMDARCGVSADTEELAEKVRQAWNSRGWSITSLTTRKGFHVDESSPVPGMIDQVCRQLTGLDRPLFHLAGGTYSRYLPNSYSVGVGSSWDGYVPQMVFPEGHGGFHQPDEALDVGCFMMAIRIITHLVLQCDELLHA